jgi:hypothetical protein
MGAVIPGSVNQVKGLRVCEFAPGGDGLVCPLCLPLQRASPGVLTGGYAYCRGVFPWPSFAL